MTMTKKISEYKMATRNMKNRRLFLARYSLPIFFFVNLNWFIPLFLTKNLFLLIPLLLMIASILAMFEIIRSSHHSVDSMVKFPMTQFYFISQSVVNLIISLPILIFNDIKLFFPFLSNVESGRGIVSGILLLGIGLCVWNLNQLATVIKKKDRWYLSALKYESILKEMSE
ncbi:hypothetical protein [Aerococcus loyolae]|uniref:Uncharacterized protein n=1 Tax=Aerococcus loyolae TaxID=2976809 RepID=A0ABT4BZZ1_9LACT|nr:hypothetical protein [Aerococcus loyolae]MCY3025295.1 hypothetical protein [Aerococcus loyolae]MCY3027791.1 hypothetical protein [Aerococcus loyolae]MCY3029168.1 hypothetical protein [Aerococcus loyolae]